MMGATSFSWRNALSAGVAGGLTAGVGNLMGVGGVQSALAQSPMKAAGVALGNAAADYIGQKVAGIDHGFSWRAIAASAVAQYASAGISAAIGQPASQSFGGTGSLLGDFSDSMIGGIVGLHTRRTFGFNDDIDYKRMALDAFGNALGNAAVAGIQSRQADRAAERQAELDAGLKRSMETTQVKLDARTAELMDEIDAKLMRGMEKKTEQILGAALARGQARIDRSFDRKFAAAQARARAMAEEAKLAKLLEGSRYSGLSGRDLDDALAAGKQHRTAVAQSAALRATYGKTNAADIGSTKGLTAWESFTTFPVENMSEWLATGSQWLSDVANTMRGKNPATDALWSNNVNQRAPLDYADANVLSGHALAIVADAVAGTLSFARTTFDEDARYEYAGNLFSFPGEAKQWWNTSSGMEKFDAVYNGVVGAAMPAGAAGRLIPDVANSGNAARLSFGELRALKTAGLSRAEIARHIELNGDVYLFRGTSEGWVGSPGAQATAVSASVDPYVATVFGLEARAQGGRAVLQFGSRSEVGTFTRGNWFAVQEREVGVLTNAVGFAERAPYNFPVDRARAILDDMGLPSLPRVIRTPDDRRMFLDAAPKMTPEQTAEFLRRTRNGG